MNALSRLDERSNEKAPPPRAREELLRAASLYLAKGIRVVRLGGARWPRRSKTKG